MGLGRKITEVQCRCHDTRGTYNQHDFFTVGVSLGHLAEVFLTVGVTLGHLAEVV